PPMSRLRNSGTMPSRLVSPMVERMPTRLVCDDGPRIELPVSVPRPTAPKLAATAAAVPPPEPARAGSGAAGLRAWPGTMQPAVSEGAHAKSDMFDLASMSGPASRSLRTWKASRGGTDPFNDSDPAEVGMLTVS